MISFVEEQGTYSARCSECGVIAEGVRRGQWARVRELHQKEAHPDDHGPGCDGPYNCVCSADRT